MQAVEVIEQLVRNDAPTHDQSTRREGDRGACNQHAAQRRRG
jgi:hypothetical protein